MARGCGDAVVRYIVGPQVLPRGGVAVGSCVDSRVNGVADADHDLGRCGVLPHADEWSLDGLLDDVNGCSG